MCRVLEVSTSGYYKWKKTGESKTRRANRSLIDRIRAIHEESRKTYGSPRVHAELACRGILCGENRVAKLMREAGIQARHKRRFKATTDSAHRLPVQENQLNRSFTVHEPDRVWASDITAIWTREGWLYLAVVMDLYSRKIIGWSMQEKMEKKLVIAAITMALQARSPTHRLLHHSDRGSQYASKDYQAVLQAAGITGSMSRKGNCWDNAVVESFFSSLKREWVEEKNYQGRSEARVDVFQYIEVWYNRKRRHSTLGYLSPTEFEGKMASGA